MAIPSLSSPSGARVSSVTVKNKVLKTPCFFLPTSRGTVPHLTPDNVEEFDIPALYVGLEDCLDRLEASPILTNEGTIKKWIAAPSVQPTLLAPRRTSPLPSVSAGQSHINIVTASGAKKLTNDLYIKAVLKLCPELVIPLNDTPTSPPGVKRKPKIVERSVNWTTELLLALKATDAFNTTKVFFPVPDLDTQYLTPIFQFFQENQLANNIAGLAFSNNVNPLPADLVGLPRLSIQKFESPLEILKCIQRGIDIIVPDMITQATDAGVALTFSFPPPSKDVLNSKIELGLDMWDERFATDMEPLQSGCVCKTCRRYKRAYVRHLLQARELVAWILLQLHNVYVFTAFFQGIRASIQEGNFDEDVKKFEEIYMTSFPASHGFGPRKRGYQMDLTNVQPVENKPAWISMKSPLEKEIANEYEALKVTERKEDTQDYNEPELHNR